MGLIHQVKGLIGTQVMPSSSLHIRLHMICHHMWLECPSNRFQCDKESRFMGFALQGKRAAIGQAHRENGLTYNMPTGVYPQLKQTGLARKLVVICVSIR